MIVKHPKWSRIDKLFHHPNSDYWNEREERNKQRFGKWFSYHQVRSELDKVGHLIANQRENLVHSYRAKNRKVDFKGPKPMGGNSMTQLTATTYAEVIMTKTDSRSVDGVVSTALTANRLARLENQLNHLLACHAFYELAVRTITNPEFSDELDDHH